MVQIQLYKSVTNPETGFLESVPSETIDVAEKDLPSIKTMGLASTFSYMPVTTRDVVNGAAVEMMSEPLFAGIMKTIGTIATFGGGGATALGLGLNFGTDAIYLMKNYYQARNPEAFWDDYFADMKEANADASKFGKFAQGLTAGQSFVLGGAASELANQSNSVMFNAGNIVGNIGSLIGLNVGLTRSVAGLGLEGAIGNTVATQSFVTTNAMSAGLDEMSQKMGMGFDTTAALGSGLAMSAASWATGSLFMHTLPWMAKPLMDNLKGASVGMPVYSWGNAVGAGMQNVAWDATERWMYNQMPHDTPDVNPFDPVSLATSMGLGMAFSAFLNRRGMKTASGLNSDKHITEDVADKIDDIKMQEPVEAPPINRNLPLLYVEKPADLTQDALVRMVEKETQTAFFASRIGTNKDEIISDILNRNYKYNDNNFNGMKKAFDSAYPNYDYMNVMKYSSIDEGAAMLKNQSKPVVLDSLKSEEGKITSEVSRRMSSDDFESLPETIKGKSIAKKTVKFQQLVKNFKGNKEEFLQILEEISSQIKSKDIPNHLIEKRIGEMN